MKNLLLALLVFVSTILTAQLQFTNYSNVNDVTCLLENGNNIWVGTTGGIVVRNKSNGSIVNTFTTNNGLSNNHVRDMEMDASGRIWIATSFGITVYDNGSWTYYTQEETGVGDFLIMDLAIDYNNNVWLAATYYGLTKFDGSQWTNYSEADGLPDQHARCVAIDNGGNVWIGTPSGLSFFDGFSFVNYTESSTSGDLVYDNIINLSVDNLNNKWITYYDYGGITKFDGINWTTYTTSSTGGGLPSNATTCSGFDALGNIWVGTPYGISKFNGTTWTYWDESDGMVEDNVSCFIVDAEGNKWVGSFKGLMRFNDSDWSSFIQTNGIANNLVYDVLSLASGETYFATQNGFSELTGANSWLNYTSTTGLPAYAVYGLAKDDANNVWLATNNGVFTYNGTSFGTVHYPGLNVNCVTYDELTGNIWIGFGSNGAAVYNGSTWTTYTTASGLADNIVFDIAIHPDGSVWFATYNGLTKKVGSTWTTYNTSNSDLPHNCCNAVAFDDDENIWIGTNAMLAKFDGASTWQIYSTVDSSIPNMYVRSLMVDNLGKIYAGTFGGFSVGDGINWSIYSVPEGLVGEDVLAISQNPSTNDIWVATGNGVSKITCTSPVADFEADTICFIPGANLITTITSVSEGVDNNTHFSWDIGNDGDIEHEGEEINVIFDGPGTFPVKLIVANYHCSSEIIKNVVVKEMPQIALSSSGTVNVCEGSGFQITAQNLADASTIYVENFNYSSLAFSGWAQEGLGAGNWNLSTSTNMAGVMAPELHFYFNPSFTGESKMISPIINTTDNSTIYLSFNHMVDHYASNYTIGVKTSSDGTNWTTVWSNNVGADIPTTVQSVTISNSDVGSPNFRLAFFFEGNSYNIDNWYIDNITISKTPGTVSSVFYNYQWSTGENTNSINVEEYGRYNVVVSNSGCVAYSDTVEVNFVSPIEEQICMVTVDTVSGKNIVVWEKTPTNSIVSYNVYKLQGSGYTLLATIPYQDSLSVFIDPTSQPEVHADRYKISTIDTCGNESELSPYHQTINLGVSLGTGATPPIVLAWNDYVDEDGNFTPLYYYIYKGESPGSMELYDSLTYGLPPSFNVINPGTYQYYRVSVRKDDLCYPTYGGGASVSCEYSLEMIDSYGDGWNGNTLTLTIGGVPQVFTLEAGAGPETVSFTVNSGDEIYATFASVQWPYENQYTIFDSEGNPIFTDGTAGTTAPSANNTFVAIASCNAAKDVSGPYSQSVSNLEDNGIAVDISENVIGRLSVSPNPFSDFTIITIPDENAGNYSVRISDVTGKIVRTETNISGNRFLFKRENLESGLYFVEINGENVYVERVIIK
ncbi:MAG: T9SS type A sorting domain-containing protein [Bacteroidales bacterium]|nr:T9SS type A sorting domain-containing protein [Bacteroidales bacterium]